MEKLTMMRESQEELVRIREAYKEEIKTVTQHLESKVAALEAYRTRVLELEQIVTSKEELIELQKQMLNNASELNHEKLQAVESKYQTQMAINRSLEEKILDLGQRLELEKAKRSVHSPDTSSCHEVNVTTTAGMSPHSSPLSASLASSEGSTAFHDREVKNLQAIVDQKESTSKSKQDDLGEGSNDDRQLTSSTKTD
ncbi:hypothetical protein NQ318_007304 [Aromia moschata]|uniref:Uncharacterized protein n=1 Tax=Aromia moschata TaxID=1265417 RepID=A0AAV8YZ45_9CUCU|nr:hypothetical protein NQ318_007304 [Aromia moschata]